MSSNIRRTLERGLALAQGRHDTDMVDIFQHGLDELHWSESNDDSNPPTNPFAHLEQDTSYAALPKDKFAEETPRVSIHVRSHRRLNGDPDGISVKAALDGIVERGILADDSSKQVKSITFENITGCKAEQEQTVIIITQEN